MQVLGWLAACAVASNRDNRRSVSLFYNWRAVAEKAGRSRHLLAHHIRRREVATIALALRSWMLGAHRCLRARQQTVQTTLSTQQSDIAGELNSLKLKQAEYVSYMGATNT